MTINKIPKTKASKKVKIFLAWFSIAPRMENFESDILQVNKFCSKIIPIFITL